MEDQLPLDVRAVVLDETEYWNMPPEVARHVASVGTIYIYDKNTHVHIASFQASYELYPVDRQVVLNGVDEDLREKILDWFEETPIDWQVEYMNTWDIDAIEANPTAYQYEKVDTYYREDIDDIDEFMEELAGDCRSDGVLA